jgi:hypothetical protein
LRQTSEPQDCADSAATERAIFDFSSWILVLQVGWLLSQFLFLIGRFWGQLNSSVFKVTNCDLEAGAE